MASSNTTLITTPVLTARPHWWHQISTSVKVIFVVLAAFVSLGMIISATTGASVQTESQNHRSTYAVTLTQEAHAGFLGFVGGEQSLGHGMDNPSPWKSSFTNIQLEEKQGRVFTIKEAIGANLGYVNYAGEGDGGLWVVATDADRMQNPPKTISKDSEKLVKLRSVNTIVFGGMLTSFADFINGFTGMFYDLIQGLLGVVYNPHTVCADPKDSNCVLNLVKITSGGDKPGNHGVIGAMRDALFNPFVTPVLLIVVVGAAWVYVRSKAAKETFVRLGFALGALVAGVSLLMNPGLFTSFPIRVIQELNGAVMTISTSAGDSETGAASDGNTSGTSSVCKSSAKDTSSAEKTVLAINSMTCTIWRVIRLDPYARAQFGRPFSKLDVKDPEIAEIIKKAEVDPNTFCVPLRVEGVPSDYKNKTLRLDESSPNKVCNLAAYQLYLQSDVQIGDHARKQEHGVNQDWYKLIAVVHADENLWNTWTYGWSSGFNRFMVTSVAMATFAPIGFILVVFALISFGQILLISLMMMVTPVIFLMMLHKDWGFPKGKAFFKAMLGAILVFLMYSLILQLSMIFLAAIFDTIDDIGLVMVFCLVLTYALWQNRRRILTMLNATVGSQNQYVRSAVDNVLNKQRAPGGYAESVLGAVRATNLRAAWRNRNMVVDNETGEKAGFLRNVSKDFTDALEHSRKNAILTHKPNSVKATALRARDAMDLDREKELNLERQRQKEELDNVFTDQSQAMNSVKFEESRAKVAQGDAILAQNEAMNAANNVRRTNESIQRLVLSFEANGDGSDTNARIAFANMYRAEQAMQAANHAQKLAEATGDLAGINTAKATYSDARQKRDAFMSYLTPEQREQYGAEMDTMFLADPTLGKGKDAIQQEFALARSLDIKAVTAQEAYRQRVLLYNDNIEEGVASADLNLEAQRVGKKAYDQALQDAKKNALTGDMAIAAAEKAQDAAIASYLAEHPMEEHLEKYEMQDAGATYVSRLAFDAPKYRDFGTEPPFGGGGDNPPTKPIDIPPYNPQPDGSSFDEAFSSSGDTPSGEPSGGAGAVPVVEPPYDTFGGEGVPLVDVLPPSNSTDSPVDGNPSQPSEEFTNESERVHSPVPGNHPLPESVDTTGGEQFVEPGVGASESLGVESPDEVFTRVDEPVASSAGAQPLGEPSVLGGSMGRQEGEVFAGGSSEPVTAQGIGQESASVFEPGSSLGEGVEATETPVAERPEPVAKAPTQEKPAQEEPTTPVPTPAPAVNNDRPVEPVKVKDPEPVEKASADAEQKVEPVSSPVSEKASSPANHDQQGEGKPRPEPVEAVEAPPVANRPEPVAKAPAQEKLAQDKPAPKKPAPAPAAESDRPVEPSRNKPAAEPVTKKRSNPLGGAGNPKRVFKVPTQPIQSKPTGAQQDAKEAFGLNAKSDVFERGE